MSQHTTSTTDTISEGYRTISIWQDEHNRTTANYTAANKTTEQLKLERDVWGAYTELLYYDNGLYLTTGEDDYYLKYEDDAPANAYPADISDYVAHEPLDAAYTVDSSMQLLGVTYIVQYGGPTITIDTRAETIAGHNATGDEYAITLPADVCDSLMNEAADELGVIAY